MPGAGTPLSHALDDGEDFELLLAHDPLPPHVERELEREGVRLVAIGTTTSFPGVMTLRTETGATPLVARGFDHLSRSIPP